MEQIKSLADFLAKMQIKDTDDANGSIRIWRGSDRKWYVAAMIADNWMVVSTKPSTEHVKDALGKIYDLANDFIDAAEDVAIKSGRIINFSDLDMFDADPQ